MKILCPRCPLCDGRPAPTLPRSAEQAFCANTDCSVICWNPSKSLDDNLLNVKGHQLPDWLRE